MPSPSAPIRFAAGTRTSVNETTGWWWLNVCVYAGVRTTVQLGLEEREVGGVVRGDVPLDAVQQVAVTVPAGGCLDRRHVGARALLGDRVALLPLAPHGRAHVALELVRGGHRRQPGRGR